MEKNKCENCGNKFSRLDNLKCQQNSCKVQGKESVSNYAVANCLSMEYIKQMMENNWMIMDTEYIQTSKEHRCVRKLYMLAKNGSTESELEFYPCVRYKDLEAKYRRTFNYCRKYIHKLTYNPRTYSPLCTNVMEEINNFIVYNEIELVLYKGGIIERDLCIDLNIPSLNLELIPDLKKIKAHDPRLEVNWYYAQLVGHSYL